MQGRAQSPVLYKHERLVSYLLAISFCSSTVEAGGDEGEKELRVWRSHENIEPKGAHLT